MKRQCRLAIATILFVFACAATAQTVYKSVDARGRVTYSSSPPPDVSEETLEEIPIAPGPTEEQRQAAAERAKELQATMHNAEKQQREQTSETAQSRSEAERGLRNARIALQEARIKGDDDWQYLAAGGRVLKQSYLDRVKDAERRVKDAEEGLRRAGSGSR